MTDGRISDSTAIPVSVITGFLGSGKTTLINFLLARPGTEEMAVLVNEFGEIGIDHLLLRKIDENIVLLNSGCLCCSIRGDLITSLRDLFLKRVQGEIPEFGRAVIETTGLADPAPIIHTLMTDPLIGARFRLDGVIATVDAIHGQKQLDEHSEAIKQVAMAERLVMTKSDLATTVAIKDLLERLRSLNPAAPVLSGCHGEVDPEKLFNTGLYDPKSHTADVEGWLREEAFETHESSHQDHNEGHDINRHDDRIRAFCLTFDDPIPWDRFSHWIDILQSTRGESLLRIKGVLNIIDEPGPVAVHGVQHVFHPPATLGEWQSNDRRSRIVFITRDLGRDAVEATWRATG
jgi:G3E family GTPase